MTNRFFSLPAPLASAGRIAAASVAAIAVMACLAPAANAYVYTTTARFGSWTDGINTVYNNVWGTHKTNTQTLNVNNAGNWNVISNQTGGGIKSYPNTSFLLDKTLGTINTLTATFNHTAPANAAYDFAFDIWTAGSVDEIMIWEDWAGAVGPIASSYTCGGACPIYTNVSIGGTTWNVYSNGKTKSFLRTTKRTSGTEDIKAIMSFCAANGLLIDTTQTVHQVQYGVEITTTVGAETFSLNSYTASSS